VADKEISKIKLYTLKQKLEKWDSAFSEDARSYAMFASQFAIFIIYFWFGAIKVFSEQGAANPLVVALLSKTMPWFSPDYFLICFGLFEMIIGVVFITPKMERIAICLLAVHLFTTVLPLFVLPIFTWKSLFVPTLEGQYIIKNLLLVALAINIWANLRPLKKDFKKNG